ncbi:hypothetical protein ASE61_25165 [Bosea sp. Root670]|nr:hypothetical protein ASE61_25165 [Bosea sp. Root670]
MRAFATKAGLNFLVGELTHADPHGLYATILEIACDLSQRGSQVRIFHPVGRHELAPDLHFMPDHDDDLAILYVLHSSSQRVSILPDGSMK